MVKTYDPKSFDIIFAGILLEGFAEGTFVSIASEAPGFSDTVGVDGEVTRNRSHDKRATVTVSLMQTSESNALLSAAYLADRAAINGAGVGSLRIVDRAGTTVFRASKAWIQNDPDATLEAEAGGRDWEFRCADMLAFHGFTPDD